jgi:RNA polymerase sigma factor (sigma-70 family)
MVSTYFSSGVDADFVDGRVTPFISASSKITQEVRKEAFPVESSKSLLDGPKTNLGPEKGRLNRLYAQFVASGDEENKDRLLAEVERYARRVALGKGGAYAKYLNHSVCDQYPQTEISTNTAIKVWRKLVAPEGTKGKFDGRSAFSSWVYDIAQNVVRDACRQIRRRKEDELLGWKGYGEYAGSRGARSESTNGEFAINNGSKTPLPRIYKAADPIVALIVRLDKMIETLPKQDQKIIQMFRRGYAPGEIGKTYGKNTKWASNNLQRIKTALKKLANLGKSQANEQTSNVLVLEGKPTALPASEAA